MQRCETLAQWRAYFASQTNTGLRAYWNLYGQRSERETTPRLMNAWQAVNEEMHERDLL